MTEPWIGALPASMDRKRLRRVRLEEVRQAAATHVQQEIVRDAKCMQGPIAIACAAHRTAGVELKRQLRLNLEQSCSSRLGRVRRANEQRLGSMTERHEIERVLPVP